MMPTMRVELHLHCRIKPDQRADFLAFLREAIPYYQSPGGIEIRLLQEQDDDSRFIELVAYDDINAYARDQERVANDPIMKSYLKRWRELLVEPPVVKTYLLVEP